MSVRICGVVKPPSRSFNGIGLVHTDNRHVVKRWYVSLSNNSGLLVNLGISTAS